MSEMWSPVRSWKGVTVEKNAERTTKRRVSYKIRSINPKVAETLARGRVALARCRWGLYTQSSLARSLSTEGLLAEQKGQKGRGFGYESALTIMFFYGDAPASARGFLTGADEFDREPLIEKVELAHSSNLKILRVLQLSYYTLSAPISRNGAYLIGDFPLKIHQWDSHHQVIKPVGNRLERLCELTMSSLGGGVYLDGWLSRFVAKEVKSDSRTVKRFLLTSDLKREIFADGSERFVVTLD